MSRFIITLLLFLPTSSLAGEICAWNGEAVGSGEPDCDGARCVWTFALNDGSADGLASDLVKALRGCDNLGEVAHDPGVNHPDAYEAWHFPISGRVISVSVKDKHALGSTFVTLRVADE